MEIGTIQSVDIDHQMRTAYLDYAMSVIVSRALPDARDGLKPVHRRILYAMHDMGIRVNSGYKKSARIVGEVLGKYHPHGDSAVYEAMARMAQDFSMRYMLVDGQGNFGSIDGDAPAAMRYTEARLGATAEEMLVDIDRDTVDFIDNFDASLQEPVVLPARLPNLLLNGSSGIAVGMATNIPPHNLRELIGALIYMIDHYEAIDDISIDDLMQFVIGPDFPTAGMIIGQENIRHAYSTGTGKIIMRGVAQIEEMKGGRYAIFITEIPYQVNKSTLVERIAELVREGKIDGISDLRDESDRRGMSIVIELKRGAAPKQILNQLYKHTALQSTFGIHLLALVQGEPRVLSLKRALHIYIEHRQIVITRRSAFELDKARKREHILNGLLIALANLDEIVKIIRSSRDAEHHAKDQLMVRFNLSEVQAQAILDLQLRRLAALERQKIEDEHNEVTQRIAVLEDLLAHPKKILDVIKEDLTFLREKFGDERRTKIVQQAQESFKEEDLVPDEPVLISLTLRGYIKRTSLNAYRTTARGRRGVSGQNIKDEDEILMLIPARTLHTLLFFTNKGKVYSEKVYQIPDANRSDKGIPVVNVISLDGGELVTAAIAVPEFDEANFITLATARGKTKRMALSELASVRPSGLIAINLEKGDELGWACLTSGKDDVILVTANGHALRMSEKSIRPTGRQSGGVTGIKLRNDDRVTGMEVAEPDGFLMVVTEQGYGKRTSLKEYSAKGRATGGMATINISHLPKIGKIAACRVLQEGDEVTFISSAGLVMRLKTNSISLTGRATRGVHLMDVAKGDNVATLARLSSSILAKAEEQTTTEPGRGIAETDKNNAEPENGKVEPDVDTAET